MRIQDQYSYVRGFNFQPPWGSNGRDVWLKFDENEYRRILLCAKKAFPKLNTIRVWLSFDAWYDNDRLCISNMEKAGRILAEEGLKIVPVYFNGWRSIPDFGGFTYETLGMIEHNDWEPFRTYLCEACEAFDKSGAVLINDISNEPFNNVSGNVKGHELITDFLKAMSEDLHRLSDKPVTVGSQGYVFDVPVRGCRTDMELLSDFIDVVTLHPYSMWSGPLETHREYLRITMDEAEKVGKPVIITECCWDGRDDEDRGHIADTEFKNYTELGLGFIAHALSTSGVADLHPKDGKNPLGYMIFMHLDGTIRPYHDCYNKY